MVYTFADSFHFSAPVILTLIVFPLLIKKQFNIRVNFIICIKYNYATLIFLNLSVIFELQNMSHIKSGDVALVNYIFDRILHDTAGLARAVYTAPRRVLDLQIGDIIQHTLLHHLATSILFLEA